MIGKVIRIVAAVYTLYIALIALSAAISTFLKGQELGFELLAIKLFVYTVTGLVLLYGVYALFKNIRKVFLFIIIAIFSLLLFELSLHQLRNDSSLLSIFMTFINYFIPIPLIILSLKLENNDLGVQNFYAKHVDWNISNNPSIKTQKLKLIIPIIFTFILLLIAPGIINLHLLDKTNSNNELIIQTVRLSNLALEFAILMIIYILAYLLITVFSRKN